MQTKNDIEYTRAYLGSDKRVTDLIRLDTLKAQTDLAYKRLNKAVRENKGRVTVGQYRPYFTQVTRYSHLVANAINYKLLEMEIFYRQRLVSAVTYACELIENGCKKTSSSRK